MRYFLALALAIGLVSPAFAKSGSGPGVTSVAAPIVFGVTCSVANPTSVPAITCAPLSAGLVKSTGSGLVNAVAGTDYIAPGTDLPLAGGTLTGELITAAAAAGGAGFNLPPGSAPTSPVNGDVWTTSAGMYVRIAGATVGPLGTGGSSGLTINSTAISGGAANKVLIDNGGTLEELTYGLTGNSVIVETTSGGLLTASILPLGTNSTAGAVKGDGSTVSVVTGTASTIVTDTTTAGSISSWNIGGQNTMSASGTATLPTLTIGQSFLLVTGSGATATLSVPGGVTLANAVSQSTLGPLSFLACVYNSATVYDCATGSNFTALSQITGFGANVANALADAANATGGFGTVGTSGSNVGLLNANKTDSGNNTYSGATQTYSAIPSGTIASGKNLGLDSSNHLVAATVSGGSGGGGTFNYSDNGVTLSGTAYVPIGGGGAPSATEANVDVGAPSALTVTNLQVGLSAAPGVGNSVQVTLRDNAASQAVTCTISGSSATSCSDLTHSFNVAQSDLIDWQIITTGTIVGTPTITITANSGTSNVGVTSVICGTGLSGGTITTTGTCGLTNTAVTPGSYTNLNATINAQGQITAASNGTGGSSVIRSYLAGVQLSNDVSTPNTVLDISAGTAADSTNASMISITAFTKTTGSFVAGSGNGGMGTGLTVANATWYNVCLATISASSDVFFDTDVACSTHTPSGTTAVRRLGAFLTDASAHILAFSQNGDEFLWSATVQDVSGSSISSTRALFSLTVPPGIKVNALVRGEGGTGGSHHILISSPDEAAVSAQTPTGNSTTAVYNGFSFIGNVNVRTNTSNQIGAATASGETGDTLYIATYGWVDTRERNN